MRLTNVEVEELAELLSWTSGEMTKYDPDAHPDHNRWSWHGDGHSPAFRKQYIEQAKLMIREKPIWELSQQRLADNLREAFELSGMSQGDLARKMFLEQSIVSRMLSGQRAISPAELVRICALIKADLEEMVSA